MYCIERRTRERIVLTGKLTVRKPQNERRRRTAVPITSNNLDKPQVPYAKRESDREKAHMYRWIELGASALEDSDKQEQK